MENTENTTERHYSENQREGLPLQMSNLTDPPVSADVMHHKHQGGLTAPVAIHTNKEDTSTTREGKNALGKGSSQGSVTNIHSDGHEPSNSTRSPSVKNIASSWPNIHTRADNEQLCGKQDSEDSIVSSKNGNVSDLVEEINSHLAARTREEEEEAEDNGKPFADECAPQGIPVEQAEHFGEAILSETTAESNHNEKLQSQTFDGSNLCSSTSAAATNSASPSTAQDISAVRFQELKSPTVSEANKGTSKFHLATQKNLRRNKHGGHTDSVQEQRKLTRPATLYKVATTLSNEEDNNDLLNLAERYQPGHSNKFSTTSTASNVLMDENFDFNTYSNDADDILLNETLVPEIRHRPSISFGQNQLADYMKSPRMAFKGHGLPVMALSVLRIEGSNDTWILSGSDDKTLRVWSMRSGHLIATLKGHTQRISGVTSYCDVGNPDSALAITCSWDETLRIWPLGKCLTSHAVSLTLEQEAEENCLRLTGHRNRIFGVVALELPDGTPVVVSASADNTIRVWALPDGAYLYSLVDKEDVTWNLCITGYTIANNLSVSVLNRDKSAMTVVTYRDAHDIPENAERISGPIVVVGCKNSTVRIWKLPNAANAPEGSSKPSGVIRGHTSRVHTLVAYGYQGDAYIATACRDFNIRIWKIDGTLTRTLQGHHNRINILSAFDTSDEGGGAIIVSGSCEGNMRVWKHSTGEVLRFLNKHTEEINALHIFLPHEEIEGLIILSGSKDCTVRSWLFAKETSLRVITHKHPKSNIRINALDVYCEGDAVIVFTGADEGWLSAWVVDSSHETGDGFKLAWRVQAHSEHIHCVAVYAPSPSHAMHAIDHEYPEYLDDPLVISGDRGGYIRVASVNNSENIVPSFQAHDDQVTSIAICSGGRGKIGEKETQVIHPFFVTGSDDNSVKVWSLVDMTLLKKLTHHFFDVTSVRVYLPPVDASGGYSEAFDVWIVSGSMDNTVQVWSFQTWKCVKKLTDSSSHITSLSLIELDKQGPLLAAGDADGMLYIWSFREPFKLKHSFKAHGDEICSLDTFDIEGQYPVLLSGSWDTTISVWDVETMEYKRTIEGHTDQVSELKIFSMGGNDVGVASCSLDTTVRVLFDFLGSVAKTDVIQHLFLQDMKGTGGHLQISDGTSWPRIKEAMKNVGVEAFFNVHYQLFADALENNRADFLLEFLPHCRSGLVKCNNLVYDEQDDEIGFNSYKCMDRNLLMRAIKHHDLEALGVIVDCWCKFFSVLPSTEPDPLYDLVHDDHFLVDVMEALADYAPREYEKLICSVRLMPVKGNRIPKDAIFLVRNSRTHAMELERDQKSFSVGDHYYYLPIPYYATANTLKMYDKVCSSLGSVAIFDSDAGNLVLTLSWLSYGVRGHSMAMGIYILFLVVASCDIFFFQYMKHDLAPLYYVLAVVELLLDGYYFTVEMDQLADDPARYFLHVWNYVDLFVVFGNAVCVLLHLIYWESNDAYKYAGALFTIGMWFNMLHYLRAFETTGPLVAMILRIASDIKYLLFVLLMALLGFSQAFWIVAERHGNSPFASVDTGMMALFTYMVGDYTPFEIPGASNSGQLDAFLQALSLLYMLIVSILLLNLLIALMGDSYGTVKSDALAHWALHKAQICIDVGASGSFFSSSSETKDSDKCILYVRTDKAPVELNQSSETALQALERKVDNQDRKIDRLLELLVESNTLAAQNIDPNR